MSEDSQSAGDSGRGAALGGGALRALESFYDDAALRGEKGIAIARLAVGVLAGARHLAIHGPPSADQDPRIFWSPWLLFGLVAFSSWVLLFVRAGPRLAWMLKGSVGFDLAAAGCMIFLAVAWPVEPWLGIGHSPETYFLFLVVVGSGLRLSRRAAWLGVLGGGLVLTGLIVLDALMNDLWSSGVWRTLGVVIVLYVGSSFIALTTAMRTWRLVRDGAKASVTAERARQRMGVYLSEVVAAEALEVEDLRPGGARQDIAVLFCDLRGFTRYSESLPPERLVSELNAYLGAMVGAIREEQGVVDKFIGDAVMVVFGVPRARADAPVRAIRCCARMRRALLVHNADRKKQGLPELEHGIGLHFGSAVVGNIGDDERLQYTVVGDVVNLASRLEGATKELGRPVAISEAVVDAARAALGDGHDEKLPGLERVGAVRVRGRQGSIDVYTLAQADLRDAPASEALG